MSSTRYPLESYSVIHQDLLQLLDQSVQASELLATTASQRKTSLMSCFLHFVSDYATLRQ